MWNLGLTWEANKYSFLYSIYTSGEDYDFLATLRLLNLELIQTNKHFWFLGFLLRDNIPQSYLCYNQRGCSI